MEEKKAKVYNFFRTIFGHRDASRIFSTRATHEAISSLSGVRQEGFTLVELLVVITLLGILTATAMFLINPAAQLQKSRDAKRKSDLKIMQSAVELYRSDQGSYPLDNGQSIPGLANCTGGSPVSLGDPSNCTTIYLQTVPQDPKNKQNYYYCDTSACGAPNNGYAIYACLENSNDKEKLTASSVPAKPSDVTTIGCATGSEVYGVINP